MRVEAETIQTINPNDIEGLLSGYGLILAGAQNTGASSLKEALRLQDQQRHVLGRNRRLYTRKGEWPSRWNT